MRNDSKGVKYNPIARQLLKSHTTQADGEVIVKPSFLEEPGLHGELRKATLRWIIYRFPFRYKPSTDDVNKLEWIVRWPTMSPEDKAETLDNLISV